MKVIKLIKTDPSFSCERCMFGTNGNGCGATVEALKIGDCDVDYIFVEEEQNEITK